MPTATQPQNLLVWSDKSNPAIRFPFPQVGYAECPSPVVLEENMSLRWAKVPCRRWRCPVCGKRLRAELLARMELGSQVEEETHGRAPYELTLTMPGDCDERHGLTRVEVYRREQDAFDRLFKRLRLRLQRKGVTAPLIYFRSREAQPKRGSVAPHLLVYGNVWRGMRKRADRSEILEACGFGPRHEWARVRHLKGLSCYYAKYVTKQATESDPRYTVPEGVQRYSYSPAFMPDRESWRIFRRVMWAHPEAAAVALPGPDGPVALNRTTRWWLSPAWRTAKRVREWEQLTVEELQVLSRQCWEYVASVEPTSELRLV